MDLIKCITAKSKSEQCTKTIKDLGVGLKCQSETEETDDDAKNNAAIKACMAKMGAGGGGKPGGDDGKKCDACQPYMQDCIGKAKGDRQIVAKCMMEESGADSECAMCLKKQMGGGGDRPDAGDKVSFEVQLTMFKSEKDCKKGKKGREGNNMKLNLGCNEDEEDGSFRVTCPERNGQIQLAHFNGPNCQGVPIHTWSPKPNECEEEEKDGKTYWESAKFEVPERCMPEKPAFFKEYDGSFEQFQAYCAGMTDKDGCSSCGAKLKSKKGKTTCAVASAKKVKCKKLSDDLCSLVGCSAGKKGCKGKPM